ncbi:MAG: GH92 family glycosyl hydrolase [Sphingobacteriaceae bacterium]|nr:GH92 family glycosyl hydrolase [Sphingobacteriaceae bacterium]
MKQTNHKNPHTTRSLHQLPSLFAALLLTFLLPSSPISAQNLTTPNPLRYVNPFIGTGGHGHTFPGATTPFGMVQLGPDTRIDGSWDGCSGYHYSDSLIYGFSHTHLSGTGVSDYGDMHFMPVQNAAAWQPADYATAFAHAQEQASPGYYRVQLANNIEVALTASPRAGMQRILFPDQRQYVVIDLNHRDQLLAHSIDSLDPQTLALYRRSTAWATEQHAYAYVRFSAPFRLQKNANGSTAILQFVLPSGKPLLIKTGYAHTHAAGAQRNLQQEIPHWDFEAIRQQAEALWAQELGKISVQDADTSKLVKFYTALYHVMMHPNLASDVDGTYRGIDQQLHTASNYLHYSVFSLWDTFRAAHPLFTLIDRQRTRDFIRTFLNMYRQGGRLPVWELAANETDCMIGYHSVSVIADAAVKGIYDYNIQLALEAMRHSAELQHLGLAAYQQNHQITVDDEHESVSKQLEYAYDDWCIAQLAALLGEQDTHKRYMQRSQYWKNLFDPGTGFMRPKKNGGWLAPFDPSEVNNHFTEGNSWQYSFFVPQDVYGLMQAHGGAAAFEAKLDALFSADSRTTGREQADITGLIGQYAHGNEPSHHMAFLYQYVGAPHKTQRLVDTLLTHFYTTAPDGLIGNEDAGQMSAWYVLASLGLYQVTPGQPYFNLFAPHFDSATVLFENGERLRLRSQRTAPGAIYPKSFRKNGQVQSQLEALHYYDIMGGLQLDFELSSDAAQCLPALAPGSAALSAAGDYQPVPLISAASQVFRDSLCVAISHPHPQAELYYTTNGSAPTVQSQRYTAAFTIRQNTQLQVMAYQAATGAGSPMVTAHYYRLPPWEVQQLTATHPQYGANGPSSLIDGIRGTTNWRKGDWQGYWGTDAVAVIDLGQVQRVRQLSAGFLQDTRAWIVFPKKLQFYGSVDGKSYALLGEVNNQIPASDYQVQTQQMVLRLKKKRKLRYIKVVAENYGPLPAGHVSEGEQAYIFVDEVVISDL